uniref:Uncharacterized protein n=1 Tax=Branchiostoma floridae TaxID=7739 RepID=C3YL21_BRAFL|eukprot:XP_002603000.1 hypothetical protein BRAFLDRAFT_84735 [Branchiostoma floridae]
MSGLSDQRRYARSPLLCQHSPDDVQELALRFLGRVAHTPTPKPQLVKPGAAELWLLTHRLWYCQQPTAGPTTRIPGPAPVVSRPRKSGESGLSRDSVKMYSCREKNLPPHKSSPTPPGIN